MSKFYSVLIVVSSLVIGLSGCNVSKGTEAQDAKKVAQQQSQYAKGQPIPVFDWSLERDLVIQLYKVRNQKSSTHSVWRSDYGTIEGDCPFYGYGIPYDTSLTNPLVATDEDQDGFDLTSLTTIMFLYLHEINSILLLKMINLNASDSQPQVRNGC